MKLFRRFTGIMLSGAEAISAASSMPFDGVIEMLQLRYAAFGMTAGFVL